MAWQWLNDDSKRREAHVPRHQRSPAEGPSSGYSYRGLRRLLAGGTSSGTRCGGSGQVRRNRAMNLTISRAALDSIQKTPTYCHTQHLLQRNLSSSVLSSYCLWFLFMLQYGRGFRNKPLFETRRIRDAFPSMRQSFCQSGHLDIVVRSTACIHHQQDIQST